MEDERDTGRSTVAQSVAEPWNHEQSEPVEQSWATVARPKPVDDCCFITFTSTKSTSSIAATATESCEESFRFDFLISLEIRYLLDQCSSKPKIRITKTN